MRGLSPVAASGGRSSSRCAGLSLSWPVLLRSTGSRRTGSVVVAHGPSCSAACGIFPDQGSNPCPLHRQADSQPLRHQGSPFFFFNIYLLFRLQWVLVVVRKIFIIILFYFILFFKLINLFLAVLGLHCCTRAFSSCGERRLLFIAAQQLLIVVASRCRAWALGTRASVGVACGLSSCGLWALEHRLSSCGAWA